MGGDKFDQLYNALKADGAVSGTRENFKKFVYAPGKQGYQNRLQLYNALHADGAVSSKSYEEFAQKIGLHAVNNTKQPTAQPRSKAAQQAVAYKAPQVPESWRYMDFSSIQTPWMKQHHPYHGNEEIVSAHGAKRPKNKPAYGDAGILTPLEVGEKITGQKAVKPVYRKKKEGKYWNPVTETDMGNGYVLDWSTTDKNGDKVANVDKKQNFEADAAAKALAQALADDANYKGKWAKFDKEFDKHHGLVYHPAEYEENKSYKEEGFDDNSYYMYKKYAPKMEDIGNLLGSRNSEIIAAASKLGMTPEGFLKQYLAPAFEQKNEEEFRKRGIEHFMPKNAWENMKANFAVSSLGSAANESLVPEEYQNMRNEAVEEYSERNKKIMDEKGVLSAEGLAALGSNFAGGGARYAPDVVPFALGGAEAKGTMAILGGGWKLLRGSGIVTKLLGKAAPTLAGLTEKYGAETAAKMIQAASSSSASAFLRAGTRQFGQGALTMGFFEGNNYLMTEGREKLKEGKVGEVVKGFYTHGMSGLGTGMLFGGIGMGTGFFGRGLGITGKELTKGEVLKHGAEKAAYSAAALFAEGLGFKAEELYDEAKRGELTFGSVLENGGKGIIDKITMDIGMGAGKGKLPNLKRMLVGATHNTTGGVEFSTVEKNEILNSTGGKSLLEGLDEVGRQGKMPPMYKGATAFFSDPNVSRRTKQKVAYVLGKTIDTNIPRTERVSITQGEKGTQVVRTYSKDGELLSVDAYADKDKAEMAKQEVYMKRDRDDFLALWNDSIQPTQKENNAMFEEIASRMGESDLGVFLAKLEDAEKNGDADFLSRYEKIKNAVASKFFGDKDKTRLDVMRDVNDEYGVDIDKVLDKDPTLWKDNERDAVKELGNRLKNGTADKNDEESNKAVARQDGADLSEQTELEDSETFTESAKTVNDRQTSATAAWMEMVKNTPELEEWMKNNPDATVEEMRDNFGDDVADAYMELSKAKSMKDGFIQNTSQKIEDAVQNQVAQARFTGTMQNKQGAKVATDNTVTIFSDKDGNEYTLVGGDVIVDTAGDGSYSVGKSGLVIFRDKDGNTVQRTNFDGLTEVGTLSAEDYANRVRTTLQERKTAEIQSSETPLPEGTPEGKTEDNGAKGEGSPSHEEGSVDKIKDQKIDNPEVNENYQLSDEVDENGRQFVKNKEGGIEFGEIKKEETGLPSAPILLSEGIITNKATGDGYGLVHIEARHGDQIRKAGYPSVLDFIETVAKNYEVIRKGTVRDGNQTYMLQMKDKHNNTLMVELSGDGTYWNINTAGIFKTSYGKNREEVYNRHTTAKQSAETAGASRETEQGDTQTSPSMNAPTTSLGKGTTKSADSQENNETLTFKDGTEVPMNEKGEPDFSKMAPEQGAELYEENFGADAESTLANERKAAEKALKDANKMKISGSGWSEKVKAKKEKEATIAAAQAEIDRVDAIQKALTAKKVEGTLAASKPEIADGEEANTAGSVAAEKFQKASKVVGRKGSRTLADGTKIKGTYMIVPAESLTASHDATNGYKKSEGFPVNEEGRTINDRDYEHDKDAQDVTEQMSAKYDGQAVNQVPTVSDEGIVYDGNGRTMAGQLAAKKGTDKEYIEALKENAEAFGLTAEDVDKIEHPRVIFVPDERLPYDTETFARFNRNEKKSQSNTQEAIANSKKLSAKDVGAIISEMESSGSLDSFFNNPKAINELVKTLVEKGVIGQNEVAGLMDGDLMSAKGREFVQNLLLGAVFKEDTLKMMGIEKGLKSKALNAMRQIMDNAKLGEYSLREEIDKAVQLLYEAKRKGYTVDGLLRQPEMFGESASERYPIEVQIMAKALEGKVADFKEIMEAYNRNAQAYNTGEVDMFGDKPTKEEFINEILKLESWKKYDTRKEQQAEQGTVDDGSTKGSEPETRGDNEKGKGGVKLEDPSNAEEGLRANAEAYKKEEAKEEQPPTDTGTKKWEDMTPEEKGKEADEHPLTEEEIRNGASEENQELVAAAIAYVNGDKSLLNQIAYLKIYGDVRNRHENVPGNSGTEDGTQLAATDNGSGNGLELEPGRGSGGVAEPVDKGAGGETAPGEPNGGENGEGGANPPAGKQGDSQGEGGTPGLGGLSAGSTKPEGSGTTGGKGSVGRGGRRGGSGGPSKSDAKRKPTAKQGTIFPDSKGKDVKKETSDAKAAMKAAFAKFKELNKKDKGKLSSSLLFGLENKIPTAEALEYLPEVMKATGRYGIAVMREGIYKAKEWFDSVREAISDDMKDCGFSDEDVDAFIREMWHMPWTMDGETHKIGEWSSIYGYSTLRSKLKEPLKKKFDAQVLAEPTEVKVGDKKNIEETLPFLLPQQQDDVLRAETQFFDESHKDKAHAGGKGYMFTNGTGTGKTYTGLGIVKRMVKQGKKRILIITPSQAKVTDWKNDGKNLCLDIRDLDEWAKERGTTATTEKGEGVVITTFANFRANKALLEDQFDMVVYDESHRIMENKKGIDTEGSRQHYMLTNRNEDFALMRLEETNEDWQRLKGLAEDFDNARKKKINEIEEQYRKENPSATDRDVRNATQKLYPKDMNSFSVAEKQKFPELGKIYDDYIAAISHYETDVKPGLVEQAKKSVDATKVVFLSATPFNSRENIEYAEGYLFSYPERNTMGQDGKTQFFLEHFGAGYKYRYHRLENSVSNAEALAKQEVEFSDWLQNDLGTMSGRVIDSPYDYSRDFPTVSVEQAQAFNEACEEISRDKLGAVLYQNVLGDYNYGNALFETMKVGALLPRLKAHLDAGRKVVIFHRRVASKQPLKPPFEMMLGEVANRVIKAMPENERAEATKKVQEWRQKYAGLLAWEQTLDYSMPREQLAKAFSKDNVLFFSGNESSKEKNAAIKEFNSDDSGKNIIVIQEASGKEGISLHDTTGKHQRVCITLALPQSPITALQIEGRTYRIGNESNAIFEYPVLGLNSEYNLFASKFNQQVSTTENLALGSQARNLRESFARGIEEHSGYVPLDQQGVGGKDFDRGEMEERDPFDNAVLDYYTNQKINRNNREGVNYFPTPEPLGYKMVEWANIGEGDSVLEPSAGHGAIARYVPKSNELVAIEPSMSLFAKLQMKAGGMGRKFQNGTFEDYFVGNKHDTIVMNPPFGHAGATAIEHLSKAFGHLEEGGRIVAIIPRGATDKKFDKWLGTVSKAVLRAEVNLPDIAFQQAGTKVNCRVVVLDRISDPALREKAGYPEKVDLSGHYDKIEDFFNDLRDVEMPDRIIDTNFKMQKLSKSLARNLKDVKGVRSVDIDKSGVRVDLSRDWRDYSISFSGSDNPQRWREKMGETYDKYSQMEKTELNGDKQAVFGELKELACKLAGMTEDEMRRYLTSKNSNSYDEGGVRFRKDEDKESSQNLYLSLQNKKGKDYYDTVTEIANRVARGEARFAELPEEYESRGVLSIPQAGARAIVSAWVRDNKRRGKSIWSSDGMLGASLTQLGKDGQETCLAKIEEWSRDNGYWISEDSYISKGYKSDHGDEARVYFVGDKVIKFVDSRRLHYKEGIIGYLDRITLLNAVTPDATSRIIGFSRDKDGKFRVVLEQKKFAKTYEYELDANGDETENGARQYNDWITNDAPKIKRQLARRGIKYDIDGAEATYKGEVLLTDLWIANIACDEKGRYHIIDANAKLIKQNENTSDAPILVDNVGRENTDAQGETRFRKDESEDATSGELTPREREQQEQMEKHRATVLKATEKLNTRTTIHDNVEDIENETVRKAIENGEKVKAWYDVKTGEVHLYLPNVTDKYDAQKSVVHEVVGHNGMRNLLGESGYRDMMRRMYTHLSAEEAAEVNERMMKNGWDFYTAMDEWVADKAEESVWTPQEYPKYIGLSNLWSHIKHYVTEAIHKAGYNINPNVDDVKYWLWESKRALQNGDTYTEMKRNSFLWRLNHGTGKETLDDVINSPAYNHGDAQESVRYRKETSDDAMIEEAKTLFRKGSLDYSKNDTPQETATKDAIEQRLGSWQYRETEAWKDNMASLDTTQKEMSKSIKNFDSSMDVYHGAINQSSVVAEKRANFERRELKDLQQALRKPTKALGGGERGYENVNMYIYMKSGLERNRVLLVRDVANNIDTRIKKFNAELRENDPKANVITFTGIEQYRDEFHAEKDYLTTLLEQGQIDLHQYYDKLDKFIRDFEFTKTGDKAVDAKIDKLNKWYKDSVADKYDPNGNDYSGISSIVQYRVNGQFSDSAIIDAVMQAENTIGIDDVENLWSAVRGVTGYALESDHKYGIVSSAAKDRAKGMFNWYIPMRGFKEDSMEDSYAYMHSDSNKLASSSLKTAKGRTTLAQSPLGTAAAMAERAISRGEDNANKQRMYRLANAWLKEHTEEDGNGGMRLTEVPPVMVSDVWYEKKYDSLGNEYWEVATPDIKPDMSAEAIRKEITDFENDMKAKQAKGGATKTLQKGGYAKPFEDPMHKKQNIVTVWFGGKQRQIIFTGNPRAAQALNGELKSDEHGNRLMRFMGSMFTSYNVTFSVSNLSRDTLFANNNISIKENAEYYARFTAMQARLLGGQTIGMLTANVHEKVRGEYFNMWAHYKQGKAPKGDLEKLFYEFMDNGGKTGFVKTKTIDNFEDEIRKNAGGRKAMETVGKVLHSLPEVIEGLNERAENLNRFACYATSRKMGRSIMRSITDAKEVSVNFNRRGLGAKAFDVPGATWIEKAFVANAARWCRGSYMFFNAGMQGLRTLQKNMVKHPIKTTINMIGIPMVLGGYLIPLLNQVLAGDDGEKYASLPEWERRNNFCFYLGKDKWLKIPLAIELRAFYGLGDVARSVEDKRLQSANNIWLDAAAQLTQILPVDFMGEGMSPVNAAVPDYAKPVWQVANNEDWTGKPIYKDYDYMKYDPEYLKVYAGEFEPFVNLSKFINKASGGTAVTKGDWDGKWNNPAIWNNIVQGYFGGAGSDATRTAKIVKRLVTGDWDGFSTREVPMVRAMYSTPTEKTVYYRGLSKYAKYKELSDKYDHDMRVWKKNQDNPEISMKYNAELHGNSLDKRINALIKENEKVFKKCRKIINSGELSDDEAKAMQMQMDKAKLDLVNEIDNMK